MASWNIAVVGASGQVGSALVELLQNSTLSIERIDLIGSDNSEGEFVRFSGKNIAISHIDQMDWSQCHLAFFVANQKVSLQYAKLAAQSGCVVIDATGAFVRDENIPLVLPKINDSVLGEYRNENIVSVANAIVSQALRTVASLTDIQQLLQLHITSLISASFYGKQGVNELAGQSASLLNGLSVENNLFDKQLAFNVLPQFNNAWIDEALIIEQIRRISGDYQLSITIDSMLVPVFYGLTQSITFIPSTPLNIAYDIDSASFAQYGVNFLSSDYPTPVTAVKAEQIESQTIQLAHLHNSYGNQEQIQFMSVSDNIRYLGAQILLETAEQLFSNYM